jgi:hypothetical protein
LIFYDTVGKLLTRRDSVLFASQCSLYHRAIAISKCSTSQYSKMVSSSSVSCETDLTRTDLDISHEHRYLRLPHPRTGLPQLYLPYTSPDGTQKISEVVKINCSHRRTWFIGTSEIDSMSHPFSLGEKLIERWKYATSCPC